MDQHQLAWEVMCQLLGKQPGNTSAKYFKQVYKNTQVIPKGTVHPIFPFLLPPLLSFFFFIPPHPVCLLF
jgi:hypothetical protein